MERKKKKKRKEQVPDSTENSEDIYDEDIITT